MKEKPKILLVEDCSMDGLMNKGPAENFDRNTIYKNALPEDIRKIKLQSDHLCVNIGNSKDELVQILKSELKHNRSILRDYIRINQEEINEIYMDCNSKNLTNILDHKYEVDRAINLYSGMDKLKRNEYDILITDIGLPFFTNVQFPTDYRYGISISKREEYSFKRATDKPEREFVSNCNTKLREKLKLENFERLFQNAKQESVRIPSYYKNYSSKYDLEWASGILMDDKAKEKSIPTYMFTDTNHHGISVIGAALAGNISLKQVDDVFNKFKRDEDKQLIIPEKGFVKTGNLYIGEKYEIMDFTKVIDDITKDYPG